MESLDPACSPLKHTYEEAFRKWYTYTYIPRTSHAQSANNTKLPDLEKPYADLAKSYENACGEAFRQYRTCLEKTLEAKGINKLLSDAKEHVQ